MAVMQVNLESVEAQTGFDPIPAGTYIVQVTDSKVLESKAGNPMVFWEFTVVDGEFSGRKLWDYMTLNNEISLRRLKSLAVAAGHPNPDYVNDSEEMHGLYAKIKVKLTDDEKYGAKNNISSFASADGSTPAPTVPKAAPAAPKAPAKKPWEK